MANEARFTDLVVGVCLWCVPPVPMVGAIITGSGDVNTNELAVARKTDLALGYCGHITIIVSGSGDVNANELAVAKVGDAVAGCLIGTIVTGSGNVNVN